MQNIYEMWEKYVDFLDTLSFIHGTSVNLFSVFTSHVVKTKNRNRSMNKVENLEYDR